MKIVEAIDKSITDQDLTYMILILTIIFGAIPIITAIKAELPNGKKKINGKVASTKTYYTTSGKWFIAIAIIICLLGYWKLQRDNEAQIIISNNSKNLYDLKDTVSSYKEAIATDRVIQSKKDSAFFNKILSAKFYQLQKDLNAKGFGLDGDWKITPFVKAIESPAISIGAGTKIGQLEMKNIKSTHNYIIKK
ncbi:MAG: hypothetical protein JWR05_1619 [Mucilaginibacter sp.]|nr:hypothetical protein [Mucilaginibacter sp.]